jgi:hypothetical protein
LFCVLIKSAGRDTLYRVRKLDTFLSSWEHRQRVRGGAKCQKQQRRHMCLQPSLMRSGGGGGIQKFFTYLMNSHRNTFFNEITLRLNDSSDVFLEIGSVLGCIFFYIFSLL